MREEDLGTALHELLAIVDQVPAAAVEAANAALGWRDLEAELAQLTSDSGRELTHLRGTEPRLLTFTRDQTVIELEVSSVSGVVRLLGQLDPPREADVTIESAAGPRQVRADQQGRFRITDLTEGWTRVVVAGTGAAGERIATEWFRA